MKYILAYNFCEFVDFVNTRLGKKLKILNNEIERFIDYFKMSCAKMIKEEEKESLTKRS